MTEKPIIDLTPETLDEGYRRHGEQVTRRAFALVRQEAPYVAQLLDAERAFLVNIYGKEDLARSHAWLEKYMAGGNIPIWMECWEHREAGQVLTVVLSVPEGRTANQVMTEKLEWGNA